MDNGILNKTQNKYIRKYKQSQRKLSQKKARIKRATVIDICLNDPNFYKLF